MKWEARAIAAQWTLAVTLSAWLAGPLQGARPTGTLEGPETGWVLLFIPVAAVFSAAVVVAVRRGWGAVVRGYLLVAAGVVGSLIPLQVTEALVGHGRGPLAWATTMAASVALVAWAWRRGPGPRNAVTIGVTSGAGAVVAVAIGVAGTAVLLAAFAIFDAWMVRRGGMAQVVDALGRLDAPLWVETPSRPAARAARSAHAPIRSEQDGPALLLGSSDMVFPAALFASAWATWGPASLAVLLGGLAGLSWTLRRAVHHPLQAGLPPLAVGALSGLAIAWLLS